MHTKISVALNGTALSAVDSRIILQGVDEAAPNWNISAGNRADRIGQYVNSIEKRYREVTVTFAIDEKSDLDDRAEIIQAVFDWAVNGGDLTVSYRSGQKLAVICTGLPAVKNIRKWAENYTVIFRAYRIPYWQSTAEESETISAGTSGSATLAVAESAGGKLCFEASNDSGSTTNQISISANGKTIAFSSLGLASGEKMYMDYDGMDIQRIRIENSGGTYRSAMAKRTAASADDIPLKQGNNSISVTSTVAVSWKVYTFGRWE